MAATDFSSRKHGDILILFDVDETLTPARRPAKPEILAALEALRKNYVIGFVGGSDFNKQVEQLGVDGRNILNDFDYCFSENGLTAYKQGQPLESQSWIGYIGEERYKKLVKFILHYIADLDIPVKRGTFIEFRRGMINVSPIGRNANLTERLDFEAYDKIHNIRKTFIAKLREEFADYGLTYSIGGQLSFDVFPTGWNKTYALRHVEKEGFKEIHFFGDKTDVGGNDYEIYSDSRTIGHAVHGPEDTLKQITELFLSKN